MADLVKSSILFELVEEKTFYEKGYLHSNADVAAAVKAGTIKSGWAHFTNHGFAEERKQMRRDAIQEIETLRHHKLKKFSAIIKDDSHIVFRGDGVVDSLTPDMKKVFGLNDTKNVSGHGYNKEQTELIETYKDGLVLDCGAGYRPIYFSNVVNYEIVSYPTTDVIGVAEKLPFMDNSFDAVISIAVLEHVKYPVRAAAEILRVLKPGGEIIVSVPFLQPLHGYPHHYFNMSHQGLASLFEDGFRIDRQWVGEGTRPIHTLTWFLQSWAQGLSGETLNNFREMKVADLIADPFELGCQPFCIELSEEKNFELASATFLRGTKI
jgi:SAM-dependent methyltransferase